MPRGQADFGMYAPKTVTSTLADMGELAVRLSSIVEYDRRGDVIYLDDFEEPVLKWSPLATGAGYVRLDNTRAKSGCQAVKLYTDIGGYADARITRFFSVFGVLRAGIEISFSTLSTGCNLSFLISYWDGTVGYQATVTFLGADKKLYITSPTGLDLVEVATIGRLRDETLFYPMKLVADFIEHKYVRLLFGGNEYDISTLPIPTFGHTGGAYLLVNLTLTDVVAGGHNVWVDNFILTMSEP
ncbi:hypothetical protein ES708_23746 [subsurface metagenome]